MKAARVSQFGPPDVLTIEDIPQPKPGTGEALVKVAAAGVGPWDALIREGQSKVSPQPPLTPGSDLSGTVESVGPGVTDWKPGDEVYGVTNSGFCGAYAEFAVAQANMIARKPPKLNNAEAASVPVVAVTALQMIFDYARLQPGQTALILGGAGNVGAYAVQIAAQSNLHVIATAGADDLDFVRKLGAETVLDYHSADYSSLRVDAVLDTAGGDTRERAARALKPNGIVVSVVDPDSLRSRSDVRSVFFYVEVTTPRLNTISQMFEKGQLTTQVGSVLPLDEARRAHEMLAGAPHLKGKIVLNVGG